MFVSKTTTCLHRCRDRKPIIDSLIKSRWRRIVQKCPCGASESSPAVGVDELWGKKITTFKIPYAVSLLFSSLTSITPFIALILCTESPYAVISNPSAPLYPTLCDCPQCSRQSPIWLLLQLLARPVKLPPSLFFLLKPRPLFWPWFFMVEFNWLIWI